MYDKAYHDVQISEVYYAADNKFSHAQVKARVKGSGNDSMC